MSSSFPGESYASDLSPGKLAHYAAINILYIWSHATADVSLELLAEPRPLMAHLSKRWVLALGIPPRSAA